MEDACRTCGGIGFECSACRECGWHEGHDRDWPHRCFYCRKASAIHGDHIVPKALRRRHPGFEKLIVPACGPCNWRKGTRRLVPVGFDMSGLPSTGWREWNGDPKALRVVTKGRNRARSRVQRS